MDEKTIFMDAIEILSIEERKDFVAERCGQDQGLLNRVERLLEAHDRQDGIVDELVQPEPMRKDTIGVDLSFLTPSDDPKSLGRIGHFEVFNVLGTGGMGTVFTAFCTILKRIVAIKVMSAAMAQNPIARLRFVREAEAMAKISHDHVIKIFEVGRTGLESDKNLGLPYIVMERIVGQTLHQMIHSVGPLSLKEILRIGTQVASGLAAAHKMGIFHRDIKPLNILLENGIQRVKIADFGLAYSQDWAGATVPGELLGTPAYMSPEQAQGQIMDQRSDLFSLGSVLYKMCTGRDPFTGPNHISVVMSVAKRRPVPIRQLNPEIPDWLVEIINKLMMPCPKDRFQSAIELADLLQRWSAHYEEPLVIPHPARLRAVPYGKLTSISVFAVAVVVAFAKFGGAPAASSTEGVTTLALPKVDSSNFHGVESPVSHAPPASVNEMAGPAQVGMRVMLAKNTQGFIHDSRLSESRILDQGATGTIDRLSKSSQLCRIQFDQWEEPLWVPVEFVVPVTG